MGIIFFPVLGSGRWVGGRCHSLILGIVFRYLYMLEPWQINPRERLLIAQIERDETWLYGEKVGHAVDAKCAEVISKVIGVVLQCAAEWRADLEAHANENLSPIGSLDP